MSGGPGIEPRGGGRSACFPECQRYAVFWRLIEPRTARASDIQPERGRGLAHHRRVDAAPWGTVSSGPAASGRGAVRLPVADRAGRDAADAERRGQSPSDQQRWEKRGYRIRRAVAGGSHERGGGKRTGERAGPRERTARRTGALTAAGDDTTRTGKPRDGVGVADGFAGAIELALGERIPRHVGVWGRH